VLEEVREPAPGRVSQSGRAVPASDRTRSNIWWPEVCRSTVEHTEAGLDLPAPYDHKARRHLIADLIEATQTSRLIPYPHSVVLAALR